MIEENMEEHWKFIQELIERCKEADKYLQQCLKENRAKERGENK